MSGQEDFTPLVEVLVTCVGVVDVISLFAFIFNRKNAKEASTDININNDVRPSVPRVRDKSPIGDLTRSIPHVLVDGIAPSEGGGDVIESLKAKVNELEAKVTELEIKSRESSMERFVDAERYRRSRSPSPYPHASGSFIKDEENSSYDDETNTSSTESREDSLKHPAKLITRDDEFRRTIKRSSQRSDETQQSREDELEKLSMLENEESENSDDFVRISYEGHEDDDRHRHDISPIQEVAICPIHDVMERSPEPGDRKMKNEGSPSENTKKDEKVDLKPLKEPEPLLSKVNEPEPEKNQSEAPENFQPENSQSKPSIQATDINEQFIKMEQNKFQQSASPRVLIKQAHVSSEEQPEETTIDLEDVPIPAVEVINEPVSVKTNIKSLNASLPSTVEIRQDKGSGGVSLKTSTTASDNVS